MLTLALDNMLMMVLFTLHYELSNNDPQVRQQFFLVYHVGVVQCY